MADSLQIAGMIELLEGGVASAIPACAGAIFRLAPGWDFSGADPTASVVASLVLDGERPIGRRSSNRTPTLPIVIIAPTRAILAAAREVLLRAVDQDYFTLQWTRGDGTGLPVVFDCFRASTTVINWSLKNEQALVCQLTLSFTALPYGRNDLPVIIDFPSPLVGKSAPASPVTIDSYGTVTGTHWSQSLTGPGPNSAFWTTGTSGVGVVATYTRSGIGPFNLTGLNALTFWAGFGSTGYFPDWGLRKAGPVQFAVTLTDGTHSTTVHVTKRVQLSNNSFVPVWQKIRVPMPGGSLNLAAITGYTITVSSRQQGDLPYTELYLDSFAAVPYASAVPVAPVAGTVYDLAGIAGSARSAVSLQLSQPAGVTQQYTKKFTTPGIFSWLAPPLCTAVQRTECTAAGARGGTTGPAGGGPGGEYAAEPGIPVTPGTGYPVTVPSGGNVGSGNAGNASFTGDGGVTVTAHGGANVGASSTGNAGGTGYAPRQQLSTANQGFEGAVGTWVAATNGAAPTDTAAQHHTGSNAMQMSSSAAGDMIYGSALAASIIAQGEPCDPLYQVLVNGWVRSAVSVRACFAGAEFYDVNGVSLGQLFGTSVSDSTSAWTALTQASLTPPAGSIWCRALVKVAAAGAAAEVHYADDMSLTSGVAHAGGAGGNATGNGNAGGGGAGGPTSAGGTGASSASGGAGGTSGGGDAGTGGTGSTSSTARAGNPAGGGGSGSANGANGEVALTYTATKAFKTLICHRPGMDAPDTLSPFVPLGTGDVPDGTIAYAVPSLVAGQPARFSSTYTVVLVNNSWNNPSASRTLTVTVNHYEQTGGNVYSQSIPRTVTPNTLASPFIVLGELTLPDHAMPDDNTNAYFTVNVQSGNTSDRFQDCLFLDTLGSTVMIESPSAYVSYWIDEPPANADIGNIMGSMFDRPDAVSVLAYATVSGAPIHVDPLGNQSLMVYAAEGAPACELIHNPRWLQERLA